MTRIIFAEWLEEDLNRVTKNKIGKNPAAF
jgi:hypothetical protein